MTAELPTGHRPARQGDRRLHDEPAVRHERRPQALARGDHGDGREHRGPRRSSARSATGWPTTTCRAFEEEFKRQLNTNTIRELAGFAAWLRRQADEIHTGSSRINDALGAVPFNEGRYITLVAERTVNQEVQAFRTELRAATDDALGADDDRYSEQRFLQVQRIIERFKGRETHTESTRRGRAG